MEIAFPDDLGLYEREEEGGIETEETFEGNARRKAEFFMRLARMPVVAEDSGLEVLSLGGAPGVRSRRFALATENQDEANIDELLRRLAGAPQTRRGARYQCALVFLPNRGDIGHVFHGSCNGRILTERQGTGGFGYDPIFFSEELGKSFGEATLDEKRSVSHRGRAFRAFAEWLAANPL